ncbi:hypothetical protein [Microbulbifer hydrolyticus]|uniref:Uncharacterized protein n=1 Tax=Microbulbifer hydrolyticus TaxID=48074 RepID=A0A6P1TAB5_9GAMM|nr:hypothetical protein [Microbulbifer hydrolyticus]MBB5213313.1 hypothetical protein [Microbulbifer hydrolyticus]QHQ38603.1 hypothetical protein GTQ55_06115 [Microbulbifer hydrolyticus]
MKVIVFTITLLVSIASNATTTIWRDCTKSLYAFPLGLSESREVVEILDYEYVKNYMRRKNQERDVAIKERGAFPLNKVSIENLSESELKDLAKAGIEYAGRTKNIQEMPYFKNIESADSVVAGRSYILLAEFIEAGKEVASEIDYPAELMSASFTTCEIDHQLTSKIFSRTLQRMVEQKAHREK